MSVVFKVRVDVGFFGEFLTIMKEENFKTGYLIEVRFNNDSEALHRLNIK